MREDQNRRRLEAREDQIEQQKHVFRLQGDQQKQAHKLESDQVKHENQKALKANSGPFEYSQPTQSTTQPDFEGANFAPSPFRSPGQVGLDWITDGGTRMPEVPEPLQQAAGVALSPFAMAEQARDERRARDEAEQAELYGTGTPEFELARKGYEFAEGVGENFEPTGMGMLGGMAKVFHGSPHKFAAEAGAPLGRFRSSQIGTGEGAQAYGHGLYFADDLGTAKYYKNELEGRATIYEKDGVGSTASSLYNDINHAIRSDTHATSNQAHVLTRRVLEGLDQGDSAVDYRKFLERNRDEMADMESWEVDGLISGLKRAEQYRTIKPEGGLYKVDIPDEHIDNMLDWDAPLSEQQHVIDAIDKKIGDPEIVLSRLGLSEQSTGGQLNEALRGPGQTSSKAAADALKGWGIPGIKYYDGGSRAAGEGTRNYVLFDEKLATILERDGVKAAKTINKELAATDVATGQPVRFTYAHNLEKSPVHPNDLYAQSTEPAGKYITSVPESSFAMGGNYEYGEISFDNPLVIDWGSGSYQDADNWKQVLPKRYDGKTGHALSEAIKADGYDGIMTVQRSQNQPDYVSEIVDLRDEAYKPDSPFQVSE